MKDSALANPIISVAIDALTWVFWLAAFAAAAATIGHADGSHNSIIGALVAFGVLEWYVHRSIRSLLLTRTNYSSIQAPLLRDPRLRNPWCYAWRLQKVRSCQRCMSEQKEVARATEHKRSLHTDNRRKHSEHQSEARLGVMELNGQSTAMRDSSKNAV